jgi:hypothetical protein
MVSGPKVTLVDLFSPFPADTSTLSYVRVQVYDQVRKLNREQATQAGVSFLHYLCNLGVPSAKAASTNIPYLIRFAEITLQIPILCKRYENCKFQHDMLMKILSFYHGALSLMSLCRSVHQKPFLCTCWIVAYGLVRCWLVILFLCGSSHGISDFHFRCSRYHVYLQQSTASDAAHFLTSPFVIMSY